MPTPDRRTLRTTLAALVLLLGSAWCGRSLCGLRPGGDFLNHREWGRRFLCGEFLYAGGLNVPYPPFWAVAHAPLALLPVSVAFACHLGLGLVALCFMFQSLTRLGGAWSPLPATLAVMALSRPILRDLEDGGSNLILGALVWGGLHAWKRRRDGLAGAALGLVTALKCTALLAVAYLAWKRQGRAVFFAGLWAVGFSACPVFWQGSTSFRFHLAAWTANLQHGLTQSDPRVGILGAEEVRNLAFRPTLGRLLLEIPGHPLDPLAATWFLRLASAGLALGCFRAMGSAGHDRASPATEHESAAVLVLMAVLSPITWLPHLVGCVPAACLLLRSPGGRGRARVVRATLLVVVLVFLRGPVNPAVVGPGAAHQIQFLGLTTWALLALLGLTLANRHRIVREDRAVSDPGGAVQGDHAARPAVLSAWRNGSPMTVSSPR